MESALKQALVLRGSRDSPGLEAYEQFVQEEGSEHGLSMSHLDCPLTHGLSGGAFERARIRWAPGLRHHFRY